MRMCWCGHDAFLPFNAEYGQCAACGTLVSQKSLTDEQLTVNDDDADFYGKQYWLGHQAQDLGFPDIYARARNDLTERNLHWLRTLLKYRPPPASTLELGCAHGSFVALMRQAGYDASGVEMSAWVVEFGRKTFDIPVSVGPIETLQIAPGSLDVIALMDVLEHLPNPMATMRTCLDLLKPDGILLVQTPQFKTSMRYEQLLETHSPFLEQLKFDEHLYLFTEESATRLFARLGANYLQFEPAIFAMYDMFFAVGRSPMKALTLEQYEAPLAATPGGRITQALLDLRERELSLAEALRVAEADRTLRGDSITTLTAMLAESEADRVARGEQVASLTGLFEQAERDRTARGDQIAVLERLLRDAERDRAARGQQVLELTPMLAAAEADRIARGQQVDALTTMLKEAEADRAARDEGLTTLTALLREAEADRAARGEQIVTLTAMLTEVERDRADRGAQIETLTNMVHQATAERMARERSLVALLQRVDEVLARLPMTDDHQREQWSQLRSLFDEIGSERA